MLAKYAVVKVSAKYPLCSYKLMHGQYKVLAGSKWQNYIQYLNSLGMTLPEMQMYEMTKGRKDQQSFVHSN